MMVGAVLQIVGGMITWTSTRLEMDEIMVHGRLMNSEYDIKVSDEYSERRLTVDGLKVKDVYLERRLTADVKINAGVSILSNDLEGEHYKKYIEVITEKDIDDTSSVNTNF